MQDENKGMDGQWKLNHTKIVVHTEQAYIDQNPWEVANEYPRKKTHGTSKITWRRAESILRATRTAYIVHRNDDVGAITRRVFSKGL